MKQLGWLSLALFYTLVTSSLVFSAPSDWKPRQRRSNAPTWFANCQTGAECLMQVMTFTTYRFPINTILMTDFLTGRYALRDELKFELTRRKMEADAERHKLEMANGQLQLEVLKARLEDLTKADEGPVVPLPRQDDEFKFVL